ncbi:MAG: ComEC/Rec2 family competence protein [Patescibacteria group bacterium]
MSEKYFFGFIISFVIGVGFESIFNFGVSFGVFLVVLSVLSLVAASVRMGAFRSLLVSLVPVILFGSALGVLRVDVSENLSNRAALDSYVGKTLEFEGVIVGEPDVREAYTNVVLKAESVLYENDKHILDKPVKILVRVPEYPTLHYGDEIVMKGKVTHVRNFEPKEGEKDFNYRAYLAKDNIYYQIYFPQTSVIKNGEGNLVLEKLFAVKDGMIRNIARTIPEPEAALAGGITLGAKQSLGEELLQKFRETGLAHIVVLSGYNIAIVAGAITAVTMYLPFVWRIILSATGIVLFAMMVGGGATVVRATIMALIIILARVAGREGDALRALMIAGGLMIFWSPMILLYDIGFQLSFTATLALIIFSPVLEKYFMFVSSRMFREIVVATVSTQIFVLPLLLYHMGSASLIGIIANIFVLPLVPLAMLAVFFVGTLAWIPIIGSMFAFIAYIILAYIILAVEFFSSVPFASVAGVAFSLWMLVFAYGVFGVYSMKKFRASHQTAEEKIKYDI